MRRIGLAVAALGVTTALVGCSGDDGGDNGGESTGGADTADFAELAPEEIVDLAREDMRKLESVKVSGTVTNDGQEITIDLQTSSAGDCTGSISLDEGTAELIGVEGETWMRPNEEFWRLSAGPEAEGILSLVRDKWVAVPTGGDSFDQFCDLDELLDELLSDDEADPEDTLTSRGTEDLDGEEVVLIDKEDAGEDNDGTATSYVLVEAPHYLVKVEKTEGEDTGAVTFSEFDAEFDVEPPPADEVIDLESLGG